MVDRRAGDELEEVCLEHDDILERTGESIGGYHMVDAHCERRLHHAAVDKPAQLDVLGLRLPVEQGDGGIAVVLLCLIEVVEEAEAPLVAADKDRTVLKRDLQILGGSVFLRQFKQFRNKICVHFRLLTAFLLWDCTF